MAAKKDRSHYFNKKELKERGWTEAKIKSWLKKPDTTSPNPFYRSAAPSQLFLKTRVEKFEKSTEFKEWQEKSLKRREAQSKRMTEINKKKKEDLLKHIDTLNIVIPKMKPGKLYAEACWHYNALWASRDNHEKEASLDNDKKFLNRIAMNMLRHEQSHYEKVLYSLFGKVGRIEGYLLLKEKINKEILKLYPFLEDQ